MRIAQYLARSPWGDVTPHNARVNGMGGRETACVMLGEAWAEQGHEVINFVPLTEPFRDGAAKYMRPQYSAAYLRDIGADLLVSWEDFEIVVQEGVREGVGKIMVGAQVADLDTIVGDFDADELVDAYGVLSRWHGEYLHKSTGIAREKMVVTPNGVRLDDIEADMSYGNPPYEFIYSSSPDRGLNHLLDVWPRIIESWPGSKLHVCYGVENWVNIVAWTHNMQSVVALDIMEKLNQPGVDYHGRIGQAKLHELQTQSDALLYPCDTMRPTETGCITVVEASAAGAVPIITSCDCLGDEFRDTSSMIEMPYSDDLYFDEIVNTMANEHRYLEIETAAYEMALRRDWSDIAAGWQAVKGA